jgi:hypothetical protein
MTDRANVEWPWVRQIVGEGSRPRDPSLPKPSTFYVRGQKNTLELTHVLSAREDPTSPVLTRNGRNTTGYVGQAARPPRFAPRGRLTTFLFPT